MNEMVNVKEYLISLGYSNESIEKILGNNSLTNFKEDTLLIHIKNNYNFFITFGYNHKDILKMTKTLPTLYGYSIENIKQKIEDLISLGYSKSDVIKMTKLLPALYSLSIENIKQKIEDLISLGYSKSDVIKMTKTLPALYSLSIENIKQKIDDLISLGYSCEDVIKMTKTLPTLFGLSIENIKQKIEDLISLGYSKNDVIKMTKTLPTLFGLSIENIKQKIEFYKEINLEFIMVCDTKNLMQSIDLTYARYVFFKDKGIEINKNNYKKLFFDAKRFKKQYGIDKSTLLEKYNYQEYKEKKDNGIFI